MAVNTALTSEVKALALVIVGTHDAITQHDAWSHSEAVRADAVRTAVAAVMAAEAIKVAAEVAAREASRGMPRDK